MASTLVAESLRTPNDLGKVVTLRERIRAELASVESQLNSGAKDQLDATRDGLSKLMDTRVAVGEIREQMVNVERLCEDPRTRVEGFARIRDVSRIHRHFVATLEMVTQLRDLSHTLSVIQDMLDADRSNILGPAHNLLAIHFHLTQLESFKNEALLQAKRASQDAVDILTRYFERLNSLLETFDAHYKELSANLVQLTKAGNAAVAVKIAKIAEIEGSRDEKALAIRMVKKKGAEVASKFKSLQADARVFKHYREKVVTAIRNSAKEAIEAKRQKYPSPLEFIDKISWFYKDLVMVEDQLPSRFPPDWKIYSIFVKAYHKALYDFLNEFVASEPDAGTLLALTQFTKDYTKEMTKELEIPVEWLEPKLLDGKQQELIEDYLKLIVKKMEEWTHNLMRTETAEFVARTNPPDEDADHMYGMQGAVIMFQMVNQQVDLAADSNQGMIVARVVEEANRSMRSTQAAWIKLIDQELKKQTDKSPDEVAGGLVEYVIALANDQIKSADFVEVLLTRTEPIVTDKYRPQITERLNDAMDGYLDVAKKCIQALITIVFNDLKPATKLLFTSSWYVDDPMVQIIETIADYLRDFQDHLNPSLFELLVEDLIDTFLITELYALRKGAKLKIPAAGSRLREDVRKAFQFFSTVKANRQELEAYFEVLDYMLKIITASKTMFFLDYWPFARRYGANLAFIEAVLRNRDDLERKQVNEIMEGIKRKVQEEGLGEPEHSIFSRLPVEKSGFANIF